MNEILNVMGDAITNNYWIAPIIALLAGILTSITPCSLSTIPLVLGCVSGNGDTQDTKRAFKISIVFALGMAITYTILGAAASVVGKFLSFVNKGWYIFLGVIMVLMALQTLEVVTIVKPTNLQSKNTKKGYIGALLAGILGGLFSSPCSTPVLVVLLALCASQGSMLFGILLLLIYSIGNSILVIVAGTSVGTIRKILKSEKYGKFSTVLKYILGILILMIGFYMFYLGF